jgi:hypothetical protein
MKLNGSLTGTSLSLQTIKVLSTRLQTRNKFYKKSQALHELQFDLQDLNGSSHEDADNGKD